jgi:hypothetical protein
MYVELGVGSALFDANPDPDPDLDLDRLQRGNPDRHKDDADPQHCKWFIFFLLQLTPFATRSKINSPHQGEKSDPDPH